MHDNANTDLLLQVKSAVETFNMCRVGRVTHHEQVIGLLIGTFFIFEAIGMLIVYGMYFFHNFSGVCFLLLFDFPLTLSIASGRSKIRRRMPPHAHARHAITGVWD